MTVDLGNGHTLKISTTGGNKDAAFYVQSLKVNGKQWAKSWVTWQDVFEKGGTMEFVLGSQPANWAAGEVPPSPASGDSA
jgi:putative alpha-1,2-mannosidase